MRPVAFDYHAPVSLDEALEGLARSGADAKVLAGGQSLIPLLNMRLARPAVVIDLGRIPDLAGIARHDGRLRLGAMVTHTQIERSGEVAAAVPLLPAAARHIGHEAIRNRGTLGGSLAHADPLAEWPVAVTALGGRVKAMRAGGERWIPIERFLVGPLTTSLEPDEVVTEVEIPIPAPRTGWAFVEMSRRPGDFAIVAVAALVSVDASGVVNDLRLSVAGAGVPGHRASVPLDVSAGRRPDADWVHQTTDAVGASLQPEGDIHASAADRRQIAAALIRRALGQAADRARRAETA